MNCGYLFIINPLYVYICNFSFFKSKYSSIKEKYLVTVIKSKTSRYKQFGKLSVFECLIQ